MPCLHVVLTLPIKTFENRHCATGTHPSQTLVSFRSVFFIDSRLLIFASMSAILASALARISALVVRRDTRSDKSSAISASEKPSSWPAG